MHTNNYIQMFIAWSSKLVKARLYVFTNKNAYDMPSTGFIISLIRLVIWKHDINWICLYMC